MTDTPTPPAREVALRKAYSLATSDLRTAHHDEFERLQVKHAKDLGIDYKPKQTPQQKAASEFDRLVEQHPFLLERATNLVGGPSGPDPTTTAPTEP